MIRPQPPLLEARGFLKLHPVLPILLSKGAPQWGFDRNGRADAAGHG